MIGLLKMVNFFHILLHLAKSYALMFSLIGHYESRHTFLVGHITNDTFYHITYSYFPDRSSPLIDQRKNWNLTPPSPVLSKTNQGKKLNSKKITTKQSSNYDHEMYNHVANVQLNCLLLIAY